MALTSAGAAGGCVQRPLTAPPNYVPSAGPVIAAPGERLVMALELRCEAHRYNVEARDLAGRKALSISVDGLRVPLEEMAKVTAAMPSDFTLPEPPRDSRCVGPRAVIALVVDARGGGDRRLATIEVSPARRVRVRVGPD